MSDEKIVPRHEPEVIACGHRRDIALWNELLAAETALAENNTEENFRRLTNARRRWSACHLRGVS